MGSPPLRRGSVAILAALAAGCVFGPRQLEKGHLAYNAAVKSAEDEELLLNIVRIRYVDTLDFMSTASISSQLVLSVTAGASGGTDVGSASALGRGEFSYSTRPTFTFQPQRGEEFARQLMEPVSLEVLTHLVASDWDMKMLSRLLVRRFNDVDNELGLPSPQFKEVTERLERLQIGNQLFVGFVPATDVVSDPIEAGRVSGTDLVEAAKSGFQFRRQSKGGPFVLTADRPQPVLAVESGSEDAQALMRLLRLKPGQPYYPLERGNRLGAVPDERVSISIRTGSLLRAITYLSQGVQIPEEHIEQGLTTREWPPTSPGGAIDDLFTLRSAKRKPDAQLAVRHRGYWFYVADSDLSSRFAFFHLSELVRLGLAQGKAQAAPVLTLPVGGP